MNFRAIFAFSVTLLLLISCKRSNDELFFEGHRLSTEKKYDKAIEIYSHLLERDDKLQLAYYNRGICQMELKKYSSALADFNRIIDLQTYGGDFVVAWNKDMPFASDEVKAQVAYYDALYERAQVQYYLDSLDESFADFKVLVANNAEQKSNCLLWMGTIYKRKGNTEKACEYFKSAKATAVSSVDEQQADQLIAANCDVTRNNR